MDYVTMDTVVDDGGANFSVGERQLLNLARQLLFQPRVLILDESTASIDGETDAFIQVMLRERFQRTTLITIAHRLHTIMDYDYILCMENGTAVEFGTPADLLSMSSSSSSTTAAAAVTTTSSSQSTTRS